MNQSTNSQQSKNLNSQKAIYVSIRFGNPNSGDCRNFGICKMENFEGAITEFKLKDGFALAKLVLEDNLVQLFFLKSSMSYETQMQYFGKSRFLIEEAVQFEKKIKGIPKIIKWKPGKYLINECSLGFIISNKKQ